MIPKTDLPAPIVAVLLAASLFAAGCASTPPPPPQPVVEAPRPMPVATPRYEAPKPTYRGPWEDPSNPLYARTIYFDYDSSEIKPEYIAVMRNHARYLGSNLGTRVTLEGHTDERGTREYNLALGDQRAEAVRRFMVAEGAATDQMSTLSYGEERSAESAHGEQAWRQNRRVIIQY